MSTALARPFNLDPVAESPAMRDALLAAENVAATPTTAPADDDVGVPPAAPAPESGARLPPELPLDLAALERLAIEEALRRVDGNRTHAARLLGIGLRTLRNKLRTWRESGEVVLDPLALHPTHAAGAAARPFLPGPLEDDAGAGLAGLAFAQARASQGGRA